ncbi:MAG: C39 family peptidase [Deltaproteobacteria bacterium]|nr:C39 family peptidase [Deltaproteobacteria bacterium]
MSSGIIDYVNETDIYEPEPGGELDPQTLERIYPFDAYTIPEEILQFTKEHHFIRVPLLGQYNPIAKVENWCGRTSSSMLWNYYQKVSGEVNSKIDYISHWRGSSKTAPMDLRMPKTEAIAAKSYGLMNLLNTISDMNCSNDNILFKSEKTDSKSRLKEAGIIASSFEAQKDVFEPAIEALKANNPVIVYTGLSTDKKFGGHLVVIAGYCIMPDKDGTQKLWLLIADPASPQIGKGAMLTPLHSDSHVTFEHLGKLDENKHSLIHIVIGNWKGGRAYIYLMRASKFFEHNTTLPSKAEIWLDDPGNEHRGGKYIFRDKETPFVAGLVLSKGVRAGLCLPFQQDDNVLDSMARGFYEIEHAQNGFYPLATNRALHGGVHWPVPTNNAANGAYVRSMAPGYIVAARISKAPSAEDNKKFLKHDNGFILVRHEIVELDNEQNETGDHLPFYSLYMHMAPSLWPDDPSDVYKNAPWLKEFYLARYAAIINLDRKNGKLGKIFWATKEINADADAEAQVHENINTDLTKFMSITLRKESRALGYVKHPPGDLVQGFAALKQGAVVTFSDALLPVSYGTVLGVVKGAKSNDTHGALHWEVFAPANSSSAVEKLFDYAKDDLKLKVSEIAEVDAAKKDNLVDDEEAKKYFEDKLPDADDKHAAKAVFLAANSDYPLKTMGIQLRNFFQRRASFYIKDKKEPQYLEPSFTSKAEDEIAYRIQCYPLKLTINTQQYPVQNTDTRPMPYIIEVYYYESREKEKNRISFATAKKELSEDDFKADPLELDLLVPARAESMKIVTPDFYLNICDTEDIAQQTTYAERLISARWRGLFLQHISEWSAGGIADLIPKLRGNNMLPQSFLKLTDNEIIAKVLTTSWYGVPKAQDVESIDLAVPQEVPIVGKKGEELSLFDGDKAMLPANDITDYKSHAEVLNVHPISFLWLLNNAINAQKFRLIKDFNEVNADAEGAHDPVMWGFVLDDDGPFVTGQEISVVVIERGWSSNEISLILENNDKSASLQEFSITNDEGKNKSKYDKGMFVLSRTVPLWGEYTLKIKGYQGEPEQQGGAGLPTTIKLMQPIINEKFEPQKDSKTGLYKINMRFISGCPKALAGYLKFEYAKFSLPENITQTANWIVDSKTGSYVTGLKTGTHVTERFEFWEYSNKAEGLKQIAIALCTAIEVFGKATKMSISVVSVTDQGRKVFLEPTNAPKQSDKDLVEIENVLKAAAVEAQNADVTFVIKEAIIKKNKKTFQITASYNQIPSELSWNKVEKCLRLFGRFIDSQEGETEKEYGYIRRIRKKNGKPNDVKLADHFDFSEFANVVGSDEIKLHTQLVARLELLWWAHYNQGKNGNKHDFITVQALHPNGLTVAINCADCETQKGDKLDETRKIFEKCAIDLKVIEDNKEIPAFSEVVTESLKKRWPEKKDDRIVLVVSIAKPKLDTSGVVKFEFDPKEAFLEVLKAAAPNKNERVFINTSFGAFNGDNVDAYEGPSSTMDDIPPELDKSDSLSSVKDNVFKTLAKPMISSIQTTQNKSNIVLTAYLYGAEQDWSNANPQYFIDDKLLGNPNTADASQGAVCSAEISLTNKKGEATSYAGQSALNVELRTTNDDAMFDTERIKIEPAKVVIDTIPKLISPLTIEFLEEGYLHLHAKIYCCDVDSLKITCDTPNEKENMVSVKSVLKNAKNSLVEHCFEKVNIKYDGTGLGGVYEALLDQKHLAKGKTYHFVLMPKKDYKVFGIEISDKPSCEYIYKDEDDLNQIPE